MHQTGLLQKFRFTQLGNEEEAVPPAPEHLFQIQCVQAIYQGLVLLDYREFGLRVDLDDE